MAELQMNFMLPDWSDISSSGSAKDFLENWTRKEAEKIKRYAKQNIRQGMSSWAPYSPVTVQMKMHSGNLGKGKLQESGTLLSSIRIQEEGDQIRVGVGEEAWYGVIQEYGTMGLGITIPVTDRMRNYLGGLLSNSNVQPPSGNVTIPARPFWRPAVARAKREAQEVTQEVA